jgi:Tfp pilus assembly protein PilN
MLHLLPESYIRELQKDYRHRSIVALCNLLTFCFFVFALGLIPSLVILRSERTELEKESSALTLRISDEDKLLASSFEAAVNRGTSITQNNKTLSSARVDHILALGREGVVLTNIALTKNEEKNIAELRGVADTRANLSAFIRNISSDGAYTVDDVPASTFKKDKNLEFTLVLQKRP